MDGEGGRAPIYGHPFIETLVQLRQGTILDDLQEQMQDLVERVVATARGGKLSLVIDVRPADDNDSARLLITDAIRVTPPKARTASSLMFADDGGGLSRRDPRQPELPIGLRAVTSKAPPGVDPETGEIKEQVSNG